MPRTWPAVKNLGGHRNPFCMKARCHYEVFVPDPTPFEILDPDLQEILSGQPIERTTFSRAAAPERFSVPRYGAPSGDQVPKWRQVVSPPSQEVLSGIGLATLCHVIS